MSTITDPRIKQVLRYLADRNRSQSGCWISVADARDALGFGWEEVATACRSLGDDHLAELMGGFPLQRTSDNFTLVRLTDGGTRLAESVRLTEPGSANRRLPSPVRDGHRTHGDGVPRAPRSARG